MPPSAKKVRAAAERVQMAPGAELWPVERLIPYAKNARTHTPEQVAEIARSVETFGWLNPILADKDTGEIIAGHARLQAALLLKLKRVPVVEVSHLSTSLRRAYVIADNKLALKAGWDYEILKEELEALPTLGLEPTLTGFDANEIDAVLHGGWNTDWSPDDGGEGDEKKLWARITIKCEPADKPDLLNALRRAVEETGLAGVTIVDN